MTGRRDNRYTTGPMGVNGIEPLTLCFHVYCYNLQPHVQIDYATGRNQASGD